MELVAKGAAAQHHAGHCQGENAHPLEQTQLVLRDKLGHDEVGHNNQQQRGSERRQQVPRFLDESRIHSASSYFNAATKISSSVRLSVVSSSGASDRSCCKTSSEWPFTVSSSSRPSRRICFAPG